jgi:hypothetical protein
MNMPTKPTQLTFNKNNTKALQLSSKNQLLQACNTKPQLPKNFEDGRGDSLVGKSPI